ncbi:MAG TPA: DUF2163 domain-containing protein [Pseudolabrys sp.]|nr:DUF2163 domain-containing protein [Pseudolabrys sp.]
MRTIPSALQIKLDSGVTTLCHCWLITRNDGVTLGFTDHDEDVVLGGVTCRAGTGLTGSEATQKLGMAVDGSEVSGALSDDALREDDLAGGLYDAAAIEIWLVDWGEPSLNVLLSKGTLGEIRREGASFTAEVRGLSQRLQQDNGRLFTATCTADLGDGRCTIDLTDPEYCGSGTVNVLNSTSSFVASGLFAFQDGWFTGGKLTFTGGANAGLSVEVKSHRKIGLQTTIDLWQAMPEAIAHGDTFAVTAGCDKRFATCRDRFDNVVNFRGFPHIPGNDFVMRYPVKGEPGNDGSSLQS